MNNINFGKNTFCWPSVISSITGCSTDDAAKAIQQLRGNYKAVRGVYATEGIEVLKRMGYCGTYLTHLSDCGSLFYLLSVLEDGLYAVVVPRHIVLIELDGKNKYICDNHTKKPLNINCSARLSQSVVQVIKIKKVN